MKRIFKEHTLLLTSLLLSFLLLALFSLFHSYKYEMISLEIKWLAVAAVPVLVGLFAGGYIKTFKGFGVELEYNLKEPVSSITSRVDIQEVPDLYKGPVDHLETFADEELDKVQRLRFIEGKNHHYSQDDIHNYFTKLRNLRFIEVVNEKQEFVCVFSASKIKESNPNPSKEEEEKQIIRKFIKALEQKKSDVSNYSPVTDFVESTDTLIEAYRKIKKSAQSNRLRSGKEILPVLDENKKMIGIVERQRLETKIAEEVDKSLS